MHKLIRLIVYGEDEDDAVSNATTLLDEMCGGSRIYDWYSLFDKKSEGTTSGIGRWGDDFPLVASVDSAVGKNLVEKGWEYTKRDMFEAFKELRDKIKDIKDEDFEKYIKNYSENLGFLAYRLGDEDLTTYLYDNESFAIRNEEHLEKTLNKWKDSKYKDLKVYVLPVDMHY